MNYDFRITNATSKITTRNRAAISRALHSTFHIPRSQSKSRGFTLMLAALVASLLTALGLAMYTIAQKEVVLSSLGRDSQFAFYAADTGVECALYWDFQYDAFATSTVYDGSTIPAECDGQELRDFPTPWESISFDGVTGIGGTESTSFWFEPEGRCTYVTVSKYTSHPHTRIDSLGYSTACNDPNNSRRLERAVRMVY